MDLDQLRALAAVVDQGTFDGAAEALHITPSAVSQRIKALERGVGSVLLRRSKPVRPTDSGELLLRTARQLLLLADEAVARLHQEAAGGSRFLRVGVVANADSISTWLGPALWAAADAGAEGVRVELELRRDDEHATADLLRAGEVMAAVTASPVPVQGCSARPLGAMVYRAKASAAFVRRWFPDGPTPEALAAAPVLQYDRKDGHQLRLLAAVAPDATPPQHHLPDSAQYVEAVRAGMGWGMVPDLQDPDGDLELLNPAWTETVRLYWQAWKLDSPALRSVGDAVHRAARHGLLQEGEQTDTGETGRRRED